MSLLVLQRYPVVDGYVLSNGVAETITAGDTPEVPIPDRRHCQGRSWPSPATGRTWEEIMHRALGEKADGDPSLCPQDGPEFEQYKTDMATGSFFSRARRRRWHSPVNSSKRERPMCIAWIVIYLATIKGRSNAAV